MKVKRLPVLLLVLMWIVAVGVMLLTEAESRAGTVHPQFESVRCGGSGIDRHARGLWPGWAFGAGLGVGVWLAQAGSSAISRIRGPGASVSGAPRGI